ncbi:MAG: hypothetical protein HRU22_03745 [Gammaproteobacteria bacterium]|nr:hypothetical protein [Gammaproteobacteria bacterium]
MRYHVAKLIKVFLLAYCSILITTNVQAAGLTQLERQQHFGMSFHGAYIQPVLTTKMAKAMMMPMTEQTQVKRCW